MGFFRTIMLKQTIYISVNLKGVDPYHTILLYYYAKTKKIYVSENLKAVDLYHTIHFYCYAETK